MTPNDDTLNVSMNQDDEDHIGVPNLVKMFSMATPMTRDNVQILEPRGANERFFNVVKLNTKCGSHSHFYWQTLSPSLWKCQLLGRCQGRCLVIFLRTRHPQFCWGGQNSVLNTIFFVKTLTIQGIQPMVMFHLVATICESGETPNVVVRSKDIYVPTIVPQ